MIFNCPFLFLQTQRINSQLQFFQKLKNQQLEYMSTQITCPQCKESFSSENPPKQLVNCKHNLCQKCLKEQILCPIDRVRIQLRRFTFEAFKTNKSLLSTIEKGKKSPEICRSAASKKSSPKRIGSSKDRKMKSSVKKVAEQPIKENQISIQAFEMKTEEQSPAIEPLTLVQQQYKSPSLQRKLSLSPKKQVVNFQTCLLHSKRADLICMEDKSLICASCGLFGEHKHHAIVPFDNFLNEYSLLTEECFKNYEQLQSREQKMNIELIEQNISSLLNQKRGKELKSIRVFIKQLNDLVKNVEKELISNLDQVLNYKKIKLLESLSFKELIMKKQNFMLNVQGMTEGLQSLFNLQKIEKYVPYIDSNDQHSYVLEEGEYLIRQIDNYCKTVQVRIQQDISEFKFCFETVGLDSLSKWTTIQSTDLKQINIAIQKHKKEQQLKSYSSIKSGTPSRTKSCKDSTVLLGRSGQKKTSPQKQNEDNTLLLALDSNRESPQRQQNNISPIQPLSTYTNIQFSSQLMNGPEIFFKGDNLQPYTNYQSTSKKSAKPPVNKTVNAAKVRHVRIQSSQNQLSQSIVRHKSKPKSNNNSNNMTERQLLSVLNEKSDNKRRRKLDLPQKYAKIYDQLYKDKLDILDLGGAFLGDNTILSISELIPCSRGKLKQVKLMNNKITDEIFAQIILRCRSISSLNLSYNTLTERCLEWLLFEVDNLGQLRNITLSNNKIVLRNNRDKIQELKRKGLTVSL